MKMYFIRVLQQPLSPAMNAKQCKHNSRNMKRSGDSEGEKRRKVLKALFSGSSGIFLSPVAPWMSALRMWSCWLHFNSWRAEHGSAYLTFLVSLIVFSIFPPQLKKWSIRFERYSPTLRNVRSPQNYIQNIIYKRDVSCNVRGVK